MNEKLLDFFVAHGLLTREKARDVLSRCVQGKTAREILIDEGLVTEDQIIEALSEMYSVPVARLYDARVPQDIRRLIRPDLMRSNVFIPFAVDPDDEGCLLVAVSDPLNMKARDVVQASCRRRVRIRLAKTSEILLAIDRNFGAGELQYAASQYSSAPTAPTVDQDIEDTVMRGEVNNSPVVMLINSLVEQAVRQRASDIHIEPLPDLVRVRFRIDGLLYDRSSYEPRLLPAIVTRIKVMSGMYISEKRKPQDGQFTMMVDKNEYDVRVSTLPTTNGEKCVLRLQQQKSLHRDKQELGMSPQEMEIFERMLSRPYGIILVTGPTGSGKSTTLYTAISGLNKESVNIVTVEDPVEANIVGVNQVQVNPKAELTFASVLRSILRQDPDIIMIGEIRDSETAAIAIQASITGHLVCSTLHTNDTSSAITRLLDMGVMSYLIADATIGVIAQRLVRRLCPDCKRKRILEPQEAAYLNVAEGTEVYEPVGCQQCGNTGYYDRIGVYEMMEITPRLRHMISAGATSDELRKAAIEDGMETLRERARSLVLDGTTDIMEMFRAANVQSDEVDVIEDET